MTVNFVILDEPREVVHSRISYLDLVDSLGWGYVEAHGHAYWRSDVIPIISLMERLFVISSIEKHARREPGIAFFIPMDDYDNRIEITSRSGRVRITKIGLENNENILDEMIGEEFLYNVYSKIRDHYNSLNLTMDEKRVLAKNPLFASFDISRFYNSAVEFRG